MLLPSTPRSFTLQNQGYKQHLADTWFSFKDSHNTGCPSCCTLWGKCWTKHQHVPSSKSNIQLHTTATPFGPPRVLCHWRPVFTQNPCIKTCTTGYSFFLQSIPLKQLYNRQQINAQNHFTWTTTSLVSRLSPKPFHLDICITGHSF